MEHYLGANLVDAKKNQEQLEAEEKRMNEEAEQYFEAIEQSTNCHTQNVCTKRLPNFTYSESFTHSFAQ
jgi:hypothetical protein